jgi:hypothetical protein
MIRLRFISNPIAIRLYIPKRVLPRQLAGKGWDEANALGISAMWKKKFYFFLFFKTDYPTFAVDYY